MNTIDATELEAELRHGPGLQLLLVCTAGRSGAIPGSLTLPVGIDVAAVLDTARGTVVYGCGPSCEHTAPTAAHLVHRGFEDVRIYPAGLEGWRHAGRAVQH